MVNVSRTSESQDANRGGDQSTRAEYVANLFRKHNRDLVVFLRARLGSTADAQEVAQEAYVHLLRLEDMGSISFQRAYLFRVATNLSIDRMRRRKVRDARRTTDEEEAAADAEADIDWLDTEPERRAMGEEQLRAMRTALRDLSPNTRRAFVLHMLEGRSLDSIARTMKLTERMVRYHVANAIAYCREQMDGMEE
jgi:RNA polymerase sigma-70 factor (ECF subfamily)